MPDDRDTFAALTALVLERRASPEDLERFRELLRAHPEFIEIYRRQIMLSTLLPALPLWEEATDAEAAQAADVVPQPARGRAAFWRRVWVAAAAALFVAAAVIWHGIPRATGPVSCLPSLAVPVTVVTGADSLELPSTLPGTVRLASGEATVRLASGVELFLIAPLEMEVCDAMQVRLMTGGLLADVPPHAVGFTVCTPQLEVWDLGTVFSVAVSNGVSDVFVFQGSVQVSEADGEPVDLCEAGQGVRAVADGWRPHKVAADSAEARKWFGAVAGRQKALRDPAAAFAAAGRIATQWGERWLPKVVPPPPPPVPGLRGMAVGRGQLAVGSKQLAIGNMQSAMGNRQPEDFPKVEGRGSSVVKRSQTSAAVQSPQRKESEMRGKTNTVAALAAAVAMGAGAAYAVPQVTNVRMQQRAGTRIVDVWYNLSGEAAIVTLGIETNDVPIPDSAVTRLTGDVSVVVQPGMDLHIVWDAGADWPENVTENARARVTAWSTNAPPQVMVIDLGKGTAASEADPYPCYYYTSLDALPNGGLSNNMYKTDLLVMRKVPSGGFAMGDESTPGASVPVTLTKDFYVGVYEVTQKQWYKVMGTDPSDFKNPAGSVNKVSYEDIRGGEADGTGHEWPANDLVYSESFIGRIRRKTGGLAGFDLPTDAQWEYACRAGTATYYNDGLPGSADSQLNELGWWSDNSGSVAHTVGQKTPNRWGLYDMHGNVWEWCLDRYASALGGGIDPKGPDSGSQRVRRGGCWYNSASYARSASRGGNSSTYRSDRAGFRLFRTLP
jgi:formylglycine-generating enzyme required for sulfatase activity/ferric-dicitrate binding protein FerR (iron transport regulator)